MSEPKSASWIIVSCEEDNSFSLIEEDEAVFDKDFLVEGDKVKFYFDGREYEGIVCAIGGEDEYHNLAIRLKELNANNKKQNDSFHADRPRKTRGGVKFNEAVNSLKPRAIRSSKPTEIGDEQVNINSKNKQMVSVTGNPKVVEPSSDETICLASSSCSSSPLPEEVSDNEARKAKQVKRKGRDQDVKALKKLKVDADLNSIKPSTSEKVLVAGPFTKNSKLQRRSSIFGTQSSSKSFVSINDLEDECSNQPPNENDFIAEMQEGNEDESEKYDSSGMGEGSGKKDYREDEKKKTDKKKDGDETDKKKKDKDETDKKKKDKDETDKKKKDKDATDKKKKDKDETDKKKKDKDETDKKKKDKDETDKKKKDKDESLKKKEKKKRDREAMKESRVQNQEQVDFQVLRWTGDDEDVVEIKGKSKEMTNNTFYVSSEDLQRAKTAKNASTFSKALLVAALTDEALFKCSVSGGQYRAGGRDKITQKPPLPANVIAVIVDVSWHRQASKNWSPKLSKKDILCGLRQKLVDVRPRLKKLFENAQ